MKGVGDVALLFGTRILRLFAYGFLSVVLVLYLDVVGLSPAETGLLFTLTLVGDTALSLLLTTRADRLGRRWTLLMGSFLMVFAGILFASTRSFILLLVAATFGVISPSGNEVGPFLAVEQAALAERVSADRRVALFSWYNLVGSFATAVGALAGGGLAGVLQRNGVPALRSYQWVVVGYAILGALLAILFRGLSSAVEPPKTQERQSLTLRGPYLQLGLGKSRGVVFRLAGLFTLDAFAGGFVVQSFVAYWFHARFGISLETLGLIFFCANVLAGCSALSAAWLSKRIGLLNTMVLSHLPSNVLLVLLPFMPTAPWAIAILLARFSISQMDVPTRQAYTLALVPPEERSAAGGVTGTARSVGASLSPLLAGPLYASAALGGAPFIVAGALKILYDVLVYLSFRAVQLPNAAPPKP